MVDHDGKEKMKNTAMNIGNEVSRRGFLGGLGAAAVLPTVAEAKTPVFAEKEMSVDGIALPEWAVARINDGMNRFLAWKGGDAVVAFPVMADSHSSTPGLAEPPDWNDPKRHYLYLRKIAELTESDFLANLGDMDLDMGFKDRPMEEIRLAMESFRRVLAPEPKPILNAMGNHDVARGKISPEVFGQFFNRGLNDGKPGVRIVYGECSTWGYFDVAAKKFRMIFLNTNDERGGKRGGIGFSRRQLQFLADTLSATPDGWTVAVMQHTNPVPLMCNWRRCLRNGTDTQRSEIEQMIIEDFANRRGEIRQGWAWDRNPVGQFDGIKWDFRRAGANFAGLFQGHAHCESFLKYAKVPYVCHPGLGTVPPDCRCGEWRDPKRNPNFDRAHDMMIDLVAVKPALRQVRLFRFGHGGPRSDYGYDY